MLGPANRSNLIEFDYDSDAHEPIFLRDYPREGIVFVSETYTSDQHLPNAFRRYIGLRDNMVPDEWQNIRDMSTME